MVTKGDRRKMRCRQKVRLFTPERNLWSFSMLLTCVFCIQLDFGNQGTL